MPDLGVPALVVNWFTQDPVKALEAIACVCLAFWGLLNCNGDGDGDADGACDGGDGGD